MNKIFGYIFVVAVLTSLLPGVSFAQDASSTPPQEASAEPVVETTAPTGIRGAVSQAVVKRLTNLAANFSNRIEAVIERLDLIAHRLERRASKMSAEGYDTTNAKEFIYVAHTTLDEATGALAGIDEKVQNAFTSETPRASWSDIKNTYKSAYSDAKDARGLLIQAVNALRNAERKSDAVTATTTPEVTPTPAQ